MENLSAALIISMVGMGLVFGAIFLLWGIMALIVRFTTEKVEVPQEEAVEAIENLPASFPAAESELALKQQAALAAVVVALAKENGTELHEFPLPPTAMVSAWQAIMRTKMLNKRGMVR